MRIAAAVALLALTGCSASKGTTNPAAPSEQASSSAAAQPLTQAAVKAAAGEEFDAYASGDYAGAREIWTASAKKTISQQNYEKLFELCPPVAEGLPFTIKAVRLAPDKKSAIVRAQRSIALISFHFVYEGGQWRYVPSAANLRDYRTKTPAQLAAGLRKDGGCAKS
jgi:hypothetical protein